MFDNQWITIDPKHMIFELNNDGKTCMLLVAGAGFELAIIGLPGF